MAINETEFVIVLTDHRFLGKIFQPFIIKEKDKFYSAEKLIKPYDVKNNDVVLCPNEIKLVEIIDKYSDERLMKRFSRAKNVTEFFSKMDQSFFKKTILPFIEKCMYEAACILMLNQVRLMNKEANYVNLYDEDEIKISSLFGEPCFFFERLPEETKYRLRIFVDKKEIPLINGRVKVITNDPCLLIYQNQLIVFRKLDAKKLMPFFNKEYVSVPVSMEDQYYSGFVRKTIYDFDVKAKGFNVNEEIADKKAALVLERNSKYSSCFILKFIYGSKIFFPEDNQTKAVDFIKKEDEFIFNKIERDFKWEKEICDAINNLGLEEIDDCFIVRNFKIPEQNCDIYTNINWIAKNKQKLQKKNIRIEQNKLGKVYFIGEHFLDIKTGFKDDWFDVYATVRFGDYSFPFIKLKNYILNDIHEFELPNGQVAVIPDEWFSRYKSVMPFAKAKGDKIQFNKCHYPLVDSLFAKDKRIWNLFNEIENVDLPEELHANLRGYQRVGVQWMYNLCKNGFGGCLADDMGLGKTLQILTLLLKLKRNEQSFGFDYYLNNSCIGQPELFREDLAKNNIQPASLVVLPTSLVHNWEAEIKKFTPSLKVYKHVGQNRNINGTLKRAVSIVDVILTTYGTVRNDIDLFSKLNFFFVILDESQYVKNPSSKTYKAIIKLNSKYRMAITGTPIENSLSDLWAQMNFLNRGMLGNMASFRRYFITPIEKNNNEEQQEKLQLLIRPFVLRRTKLEVAADLPPLMEQIIVCDMDDKQQNDYEKEKSEIRNSILEGIEKDGVKKSAMIILQGLMRLRQLANHPMLLADFEEGSSGKFEEIFRMLENVIAERHKVLVFSSFVKYLGLIEDRIKQKKWKYSVLTGETLNREEVIKQFQDNSENRIFLISLKAGGVGLNLTSADYVFLIDPWWNPAAENQAISRAHRIGQNKHVFVYRFITQNSIEEKIQQLQGRKSLLADKFINSNNPLQKITKEEIVNLLN